MTYSLEQGQLIVKKYSDLIDNDKSFSDQTNRRYPIPAVLMIPEDKNKVAEFFRFYLFNKDNIKFLIASGWAEKDNVNIVVYHYDNYDDKSRYIHLNDYLNALGKGHIVIP